MKINEATDMVDFLHAAIPYVITGWIGWTVGTITSYRKAKIAGRSFVLPFVTKTSRNFTIVVLTLSMLTVLTVVQSSIEQTRQEQCNEEFRRVIKERADGIAEDKTLNREMFARINTLVEGIDAALTTPDAAGRMLMDQGIEQYRVGIKETEQRWEQLEQERQRNPYPEPRCD